MIGNNRPWTGLLTHNLLCLNYCGWWTRRGCTSLPACSGIHSVLAGCGKQLGVPASIYSMDRPNGKICHHPRRGNRPPIGPTTVRQEYYSGRFVILNNVVTQDSGSSSAPLSLHPKRVAPATASVLHMPQIELSGHARNFIIFRGRHRIQTRN